MASTAGCIVLGIFADIAQLKTDLGRANQNIDAFASKATQLADHADEDGDGVCLGVRRHRAGAGRARASRPSSSPRRRPPTRSGTWPSAWASGPMRSRRTSTRRSEAGSSAETVSVAFAKFNKLLGEATAGEAEAVKLFARLGIATTDAAGNARTTEASFRDVADKIAQTGSVADKTAIATKAFGKSGAELIPIFKDGAAGVDALVVQAPRDGRSWWKATRSSKLGVLDEKFGLLSKAMSVTMMEAVVTLQPQLLALGGAFITAARGAAQLFEWFTPDSIASLDLLDRRVKETFEQIDREIAGRAKGGLSGWMFSLGSKEREADLRKRVANLMDYADKAREDQAKKPPKLGGGLGADPDKAAAAAKKAADEAKKIRDKKYADTKADCSWTETAREQRDIAANKQAEIDRQAAWKAMSRGDRTVRSSTRTRRRSPRAHWERARQAPRGRARRPSRRDDRGARSRRTVKRTSSRSSKAGEDQRADADQAGLLSARRSRRRLDAATLRERGGDVRQALRALRRARSPRA